MIDNELLGGSSSHCQNYYPDLLDITFPDQRKGLSLRRRYWRLKKTIWHFRGMGMAAFLTRKLPLFSRRKSAIRKSKEPMPEKTSFEKLDLRPGDWVEVRSEKEIFSTLDEHDKQKGLQFTKEMSRFCGGRYRVLKRVDKILIETTGELRAFKIPTVILDGVFCDGSSHGGCDRTCLIFWREMWLRRATGP
jgi:hypothetical protein